jgi:hypothetical protein
MRFRVGMPVSRIGPEPRARRSSPIRRLDLRFGLRRSKDGEEQWGRMTIGTQIMDKVVPAPVSAR